jgi:hypothetical protein
MTARVAVRVIGLTAAGYVWSRARYNRYVTR